MFEIVSFGYNFNCLYLTYLDFLFYQLENYNLENLISILAEEQRWVK